MVYEKPCRFPTDDPDRLWILLAGRSISSAEAMRWWRILSGRRVVIPIISLLPLAIFVLEELYAFAGSESIWEAAIGIGLLLICSLLTLIGVYRVFKNTKKQQLQRFAAYEADRKRQMVGSRIAFYGNRLSVTTLRGTTVMYFSDVQYFVETVEGFALTDGERWIILRAQDLIAFDAQLIRDYVSERLEKRVMHVRSALRPQLTEPLPIPCIPEEEPRFVTVTMPFEKSSLYRARNKKVFALFTALSIPLGVIMGLILGGIVIMTPWVWVDTALLSVGSIVLVWLVAAVALARCRPKKSEQPLCVQFQPDGVCIAALGDAQFCVKERLYPTVEKDGVRLHFMSRETLFIPYRAADREDVLKALVGVTETLDNRE